MLGGDSGYIGDMLGIYWGDIGDIIVSPTEGKIVLSPPLSAIILYKKGLTSFGSLVLSHP